MAPSKLRIALDWTPNTIHSGLIVAKENGIYGKHGLAIELIRPDAEYSKTPAKQLEKGEVDLAICPSESCIAYNESGKMKLQAIYAILQKDASAIVSTRLNSMAELVPGRPYGSYNARYEDAIVKAMVAKAGGDPDMVELRSNEGKLSLFDRVKDGTIDATWIFIPWEGVEAKMDGIQANYFELETSGIPYGYSPVIARNVASSPTNDVLAAFVSATREGYKLVLQQPREATKLLQPMTDPFRSIDFLDRSQSSINDYYIEEGKRPGHMEQERWTAWLKWLKDHALLTGPNTVTEEDVFTNEFNT